jgi:hypothetical protein
MRRGIELPEKEIKAAKVRLDHHGNGRRIRRIRKR